MDTIGAIGLCHSNIHFLSGFFASAHEQTRFQRNVGDDAIGAVGCTRGAQFMELEVLRRSIFLIGILVQSGGAHPAKAGYGSWGFLRFGGIPFLGDPYTRSAQLSTEQKPRDPFLPGLLLLGEKCIEASDLIEAAVWKDRKFDELSLRVLSLQLRRRLEAGSLEVGIGGEDFKFCARANDGAIALRLNAKNFEAEQGVHVSFSGIGGSGDDYRTFGLDVFVVVIADLVGQGLPRLQSRKEIHGCQSVFGGAKTRYAQSERAADKHGICRAAGQLADATCATASHSEDHCVLAVVRLASLRCFKRRSKKSLVAR